MNHRKNARRVRALARFPKQPAEDVKGKRTAEQWATEKEHVAELVRKRPS